MIVNSKPLVAESFPELQQFLAETITRSNFELSEIKFADQGDWNLQDGAVSHVSGGYFCVAGLKHRKDNTENLVLYQPQSALTGLALCRANDTVYVLLQARVEPGNSGVGQYGPTIQSTPANYRRVHGGKQTAYLDLFSNYLANVQPIGTTMQLDLGKRYFQKSKSHSYVEVPELIHTEENMIWVAFPALVRALAQDNFLNADLRSLLSTFDWDRFFHNREPLHERSSHGRFWSELILGTRLGARNWEFVPITKLNGWRLCDDGIIDVSGSGVSVGLYRTSCTNREVKAWTQPLMKGANTGLVALLMRNADDGPEFLVSLNSEYGVSGEQTVLPSYVIYPGEKREDTATPGHGVVVAEFVQSDEGGRFYQHESVYKLIQTRGDVDIAENQYWISAHALKKLLGTSNMASFQLRCIASLVIETLNPSIVIR